MSNQKTIGNEIALEGVGLHTGCPSRVKLKPGSENTGVVFIRTDTNGTVIKAGPDAIVDYSGIPRCTTIGTQGVMIHTVEHLMSALSGAGIDNVIVEIDAKEVPGMDGSGQEFLAAIRKAGIVEQSAEKYIYDIKEPVGVERNGSSIYIVPHSAFTVNYALAYNHAFLKAQFFSAAINDGVFEKEIASSRTFCLEEEAKELKLNGLGQGANYKNTLVVGSKGVIENTLRFDDEFVRHKVLDFIGDLYLLGFGIRGHVYAVKSGHTLNHMLVRKIAQQQQRYQKKGVIPGYDVGDKKEILIEDIMKILPHRFPFLLVDRVIEIEKGRKAVGIKNVTINDPFFQGHFPTRPVMPGVMMVEAMAQTAGVVVLTNPQHHGKVAFFMSVDKVKFRKVVSPGDQLLMEVEVVKDRSRTVQVKGTARVGREIAAEAEMIFSFTDASYLDPS